MTLRSRPTTALGAAMVRANLQHDLGVVRASLANLAREIDEGLGAGQDMSVAERDLCRLAWAVASMAAEIATMERAA